VAAAAACQGDATNEVSGQRSAVHQQTTPVVVFQDGFDAPTRMQTIAGGTWTVDTQRGQLWLRNPANGYPNGNIIVTPHSVDGDFKASVPLKTIEAPGWNDCSVLFAYVSPTDYWFASFNEGNDGETNGLFRYKNGTLTEVADFSTLTPPGLRSVVELTRTGANVTVRVNGNVFASVTTTGLGDGRIGLGSRNDSCDFDSLTVEVPHDSAGNFWVDLLRPAAGSAGVGFFPAVIDSPMADSAQFVRLDGQPLGPPIDAIYGFANAQIELDTLALPNGRLDYKVRARRAGGQSIDSAPSYVMVSNTCTTVAPGSAVAHPMGPYSGLVDVTWYGRAGAPNLDAGFLLSQGPARYFAQGSAIVRFAPSGMLDARNGDVYAASDQVSYEPGQAYLFEMFVDVGMKKYTVSVRRANHDAPFIAWAYDFRTSRRVNTLDDWSVVADAASPGPLTVCNVTSH
jgi:hypothetical protein